MKYEKPNIRILEFDIEDIVCTSPNIDVGDKDNDDDWT